MREKIAKLTERVDGVLLLISALLLLIATALAVVNAVVRFARLGNITWAEELNTIFMIMLVFIAQPALEYKDKQLSIGILQSVLKSEKAKRFFIILRGVITMGIVGYLLFFCIKVTGNAIKYNYVTSVLFFPRKYLFGCIIVSYIVLILSWLVTIFCKGGNFGEATVDLGVVDSSVIDKQVEDYNKEHGEEAKEKEGGPEC